MSTCVVLSLKMLPNAFEAVVAASIRAVVHRIAWLRAVSKPMTAEFFPIRSCVDATRFRALYWLGVVLNVFPRELSQSHVTVGAGRTNLAYLRALGVEKDLWCRQEDHLHEYVCLA
jgi:hypothetical protein